MMEFIRVGFNEHEKMSVHAFTKQIASMRLDLERGVRMQQASKDFGVVFHFFFLFASKFRPFAAHTVSPFWAYQRMLDKNIDLL